MRLFLALLANSKMPERLYISNIKDSLKFNSLCIFVSENPDIGGFLLLESRYDFVRSQRLFVLEICEYRFSVRKSILLKIWARLQISVFRIRSLSLAI